MLQPTYFKENSNLELLEVALNINTETVVYFQAYFVYMDPTAKVCSIPSVNRFCGDVDSTICFVRG